MEMKQGTFCPLIKEDCIQFKCAFWTHLRGTHPQTGKEIDEYDCAVRWLPVMVIETTQQTRQVGAAVESLRNHVVARQSILDKISEKYGSQVIGIQDGSNGNG